MTHKYEIQEWVYNRGRLENFSCFELRVQSLSFHPLITFSKMQVTGYKQDIKTQFHALQDFIFHKGFCLIGIIQIQSKPQYLWFAWRACITLSGRRSGSSCGSPVSVSSRASSSWFGVSAETASCCPAEISACSEHASWLRYELVRHDSLPEFSIGQ